MSTNEDRQKKLTAAFLRPSSIKIGDLEIRPITLGTIDVARELGLTFLFDPDVRLTDGEQQNQMIALLWIQSRDPDEVLQAMDDGTIRAKIRRFQFDVPIAILPEFMRHLQKAKEDTEAAVVDTVATGEQGGTTDPNALSQA